MALWSGGCKVAKRYMGNEQRCGKKGINLNLAVSSRVKQEPSKPAKPVGDLSESLRLLASKEMEALDVKEQIRNLTIRHKSMERETLQLRRKVEKQLFDQVTKAPKIKMKPSRNSVQSTSDNPLQVPSEEDLAEHKSQEHKSWADSLLSKPLHFMQQFDNLLQSEFEKVPYPNADDVSEDHSKSSELMHSVSRTLWSFLGDADPEKPDQPKEMSDLSHESDWESINEAPFTGGGTS